MLLANLYPLASAAGRIRSETIEAIGKRGNVAELSPRPGPKPAHPVKIGSRGSPLALAQARELVHRLAVARGLDEASFAIVPIKTSGDRILNRPLNAAGGKGLFTKELDLALLSGEIEVAVHSAKDLPAQLPEEIEIAGCLPREDVHDAWISPQAPHPLRLPAGSIVGTASLRRAAMIKRLRPDLAIALLRGNVETRLAKLARGEVAATLLALAGLKRLGLESKATAVLAAEEFIPAPGQGAIAMTARRGDYAALRLLAPVRDQATAVALCAERAFLRVLDGSCKTPVGAYARTEGGMLSVRAIVLRPDGSQFFETTASGPAANAVMLGEMAAKKLAAQIPAGFFDP
jgi:hydroxymethylbilane synthase